MTACVVGALSQVSAALGPCHGPGWGWYQKTHGFPGTPSSGGHLYAFAIAFLSRARARFQEYWAAARAVHSPQVAVSRHFRGMPLCIYIQGTARALKPVRARRCTGISTLCPLSCRETRIISPTFTTRLPMHTGSVAYSGGDHTCAPPEPAPMSCFTTHGARDTRKRHVSAALPAHITPERMRCASALEDTACAARVVRGAGETVSQTRRTSVARARPRRAPLPPAEEPCKSSTRYSGTSGRGARTTVD